MADFKFLRKAFQKKYLIDFADCNRYEEIFSYDFFVEAFTDLIKSFTNFW